MATNPLSWTFSLPVLAFCTCVVWLEILWKDRTKGCWRALQDLLGCSQDRGQRFGTSCSTSCLKARMSCWRLKGILFRLYSSEVDSWNWFSHLVMDQELFVFRPCTGQQGYQPTLSLSAFPWSGTFCSNVHFPGSRQSFVGWATSLSRLLASFACPCFSEIACSFVRHQASLTIYEVSSLRSLLASIHAELC